MTILVAGASESVGDQQIEKRKKKERVAITLFSSLTTSCSAHQYEGFFFLFGRPKIFDRDPENFKQPL